MKYENNSSVFHSLKTAKYRVGNLLNHSTGKPARTEFSFWPESNSTRMPIIDGEDVRLTATVMPFGYVTVADIVEGPDHPWTKHRMRAYISEAVLDVKNRVESARVLGFLMEYKDFPEFLHTLLSKSAMVIRGIGSAEDRLHFTEVKSIIPPDSVGKFLDAPKPY